MGIGFDILSSFVVSAMVLGCVISSPSNNNLIS